MFSRMSAGHFLQRQRKVTICALVQSALGLNVVLVVPLVMFSLTAHNTASAYQRLDLYIQKFVSISIHTNHVRLTPGI